MISDDLSEEMLSAEAYQRVLPEMMALPKEAVRRPNLEIGPAVATALGILPRLRSLRERLARLPEFDSACVDRLEDYAMALTYAESLFRSSGKPEDELPALLEEATRLKLRFLSDADALATRELLDRGSLRNLTGWSGYKNVASDLQALVCLLHGHWPEIQGKCAIDPGELDHAGRLASHMVRLAGLREFAPRSRAEPRDLRARAFTLFLHAYEQAQRGVAFLLFGQPDCELVVPCLYSKGGGIRRKPRTKSGRPGDGVIEGAGAAVPTSPPLFSPPHLLPSAQS